MLAGLLASIPIMLGYFPIAFSFGISALQAGINPWIIAATSLFIYAGAAQFILIALLAAGGSFLTVVPTIILINTRHLFYGPALIHRLRPTGSAPHFPMAVLAYGLTDEVFASALARIDRIPIARRESWYVGLQIGAYAAWVGGTIVGITIGQSYQQSSIFITALLSFILPALFFTLLLESSSPRRYRTIVVTALATLLLQALLPTHHALVAGMLIGASFTMIRPVYE